MFLQDESGAVTVDWVVLTAGLVGLGLATMTVVSSGVQDLSTDVDAELTGQTIYTSFTQRDYPALYAAAVATGSIYPDEIPDAAAYVEQFVDNTRFNLANDPTASFEELTNYDEHVQRYADMSALDRDALTNEALAAAIPPTTPASIQNIANIHFGGDTQKLYDHYKASSQMAIAQYDYVMGEAAELGLDPADYE